MKNQAHLRFLHWTLDGRTGYLSIALLAMTISHGEQATRDFDGEK